MPFPWKKVKSGRISQLVNKHLHISQKRRDGSSLVVEAGFPTSLIDLFFKNRDKLKRSSKKKLRSQSIAPPDDPPVVNPPAACPFPPPPAIVASSPPQTDSSATPPPPDRVDEISVPESSCSDSASAGAVEDERGGAVEDQRGGGNKLNGVLMVVLKVFVVVVLAFSTKRLTVGFTISAVLLLLLEYVGKHCRLLPTPGAAAMAPAIQKSLRLLRKKKSEPEQQQNECSIQSTSPNSIESIDSTTGAEEIQPAGLEYDEIELLEMAMKREESMRQAADSNKKPSRKARIKSKMQKIVPKKFRRSKKEQEKVEQSESENETTSSSSSSSYREEGTTSFDNTLSDVDEELEENGATEVALARRCMLLCLIVLVGLIGGRPFALVLTLSWFLLLKLGQKLFPRSINLSMISC